MSGLELAVLLGALLVAGALLAARTRAPGLLLLLAIGAALGFVPALGRVSLPPDVVLFLFLPALLYWEALNVQPDLLKRNIRVIVLNAIPLVLVTVFAVAGVGALAGLGFAAAVVLGAVVAPTDATAVGAFANGLPRRTSTVLRGESLVNDGTALAVYGVALEAATGHPLPGWEAVLRFGWAYAGGIAVGLAVLVVATVADRLARNAALPTNLITLVTPFVAYLPAELIGASGVLAVVTCGLVQRTRGPRFVAARVRTQAQDFWRLATYVLNGTLFLLVGFQAHAAFGGLAAGRLGPVLLLGLGVTGAVIGVRLVWSLFLALLIRVLDRRPQQRALRVPWRGRLVSGVSGFRGAVSLAAALALPVRGFAERDTVVAVTFEVIVLTLVVQGLALPFFVRFARFPADPDEHAEEMAADRHAVQAAMDALPAEARRIGVDDEAAQRLEREYRKVDDVKQRISGDDDALHAVQREQALRQSMIGVKRRTVLDLRARGEIDDEVLERIQRRLDAEELRLAPAAEDG